MQKHLKIFVLLIGIIAFNGCGNIPTNPSIDSGIFINEVNEVFFVNNQTSEERSIPIYTEGECKINPELNKGSFHSNRDWNRVLLYIRLLENNIPNDKTTRNGMIKRELNKILESNSILKTRGYNGL